MQSMAKSIIFTALIILYMFLSQEAWGQSVKIREHPRVPFTHKMSLKVVKNDGAVLKGKWSMETTEAISIQLPSGRQIIVPKSDIAELYECKTRTNEYFYYGFLIGTVTSAIIIYFTRAASDDASVFLGAPPIGVAAGLIGAVIGSLSQSCEQFHFDDFPPDITGLDHPGKCRPEWNFRIAFDFD